MPSLPDHALSEAAVLKALPSTGFLPAHVRLSMSRSDGHAAYHVAAGLIALTQTVPLHYHAVMGRKVYPTLFALNVGPSTGSRKSTAVDFAEELVKALNVQQIGSWPDSKQGLIKTLGPHAQQCLFYQEFGATLSTLQQSYAQPLKTTMCAAYDCTPLSLSTSKQGTIAPNPRLSMFGGVAPAFFEEHTTLGDWDGGFLARFMLFFGVRERHLSSTEASKKPDQVEVKRVETLLKDRYRAKEPNQNVSCLGFTTPCDALWRDWERWLGAGEFNSLIKASIGRANDFVMKIALLLAWDSGRARRQIDFKLTEAELIPAMEITRFHVYSAVKLQAGLATSRDMRERRKVLACLSFEKEKAAPLAHVIHEAQLLSQRAEQIVRSLKDERMIKAAFKPDKFSGDTIEHYYRVPYKSAVSAMQDEVVAEEAKVIDLFSRRGREVQDVTSSAEFGELADEDDAESASDADVSDDDAASFEELL